MEDLRRVSRWHGRVVNPKLTATTAAELVARVQARSKRDAKHALAAKVNMYPICCICIEVQGLACTHCLLM